MYTIQWNLSVSDTFETTYSVQIKKVSLLVCALVYVHVGGTVDSVLIEEVTLFQRSLIETFYMYCCFV